MSTNSHGILISPNSLNILGCSSSTVRTRRGKGRGLRANTTSSCAQVRGQITSFPWDNNPENLPKTENLVLKLPGNTSSLTPSV